jgi:uncharacterized protein DUF695
MDTPSAPPRRWPARNEIDGTGPWALAQGTQKGKPLFVRINEGLAPVAGHPEFSDQLGVAVQLREPTDEGLPEEAESAELNAIEDALCADLLPDNQSLLALVLTTDGAREFVFYTADKEAARRKATAVGRRIATHHLICRLRRDPEWRIFKQFA